MNIKSFEEFKAEFETELNQIPQTHKKNLIENEIKEVENYIRHEQTKNIHGNFFKNNSLINTSNAFSVFKLSISPLARKGFSDAFNNYILRGIINEETECYSQAFHFGKYYLWLNEFRDQLNKKPTPKKPQLSHKQKILALHYYGVNLNKYDNVKTAKLLSQILGVGEENTRKYLSYVAAGKNDVRTKQNLEKVAQLFENIDDTEVSNKIKSDLDK
ncbi:hypothetical protein KFZ70_05010 [Tamlana fucoidanivorans]|uniref:Uncharacterized protein n=1 Tax=Allotamlana fucoidanivorans TaxID=2583814 RepID=A0A5C4SRS0_9FLAO|nr:hypothetical protein [Tamlana fucoidanivorans]TNJ47124.1 hypothetical protein FGF67_00965 [Tamlana fucoidanivorans]